MNDSLSEQLKDRLNTRPDPQTTAWLRKQYTECWDAYRSVSHVAALAHGNSLRVIDRIAALEEAGRKKDAEINSLQSQIGDQRDIRGQITDATDLINILARRMDKASDVVREMQQRLSALEAGTDRLGD